MFLARIRYVSHSSSSKHSSFSTTLLLFTGFQFMYTFGHPCTILLGVMLAFPRFYARHRAVLLNVMTSIAMPLHIVLPELSRDPMCNAMVN